MGEKTKTPRTDAAILTDPYEVRHLPFEVVRADDCARIETDLQHLARVAGEALKNSRKMMERDWAPHSDPMREIDYALSEINRIKNQTT